jgi:sodium transport system permease protein
MVEDHARTVGLLRLMARGLDPAIALPAGVNAKDVGEGGRTGAMLSALLPFLLMFAAFMGGFYLAVDTTAGERERQSLEPLLVNPASRLQLMLGKFGATVAFSLAASTLGIAAFAFGLVAFRKLATLEVLGLDLAVDARVWLSVLVLLVPVTMLASSIQMLVAAFSRTFREAQTYVQVLMFVPMIPCFIVVFNPVRPALHDMAIPFWSQVLLISRLFRGQEVEGSLMLAAGAATIAAAALVGAAVVQLYRGERLLFGN